MRLLACLNNQPDRAKGNKMVMEQQMQQHIEAGIRAKEEAGLIDAEISRLMMELFSRMSVKQKKSVSETDSLKIGDFMVQNGYRFVFDNWHLQAEPDANRKA